MIVHKFGGCILRTPEAIREMASILRSVHKPAVVIVSALNKMTNAFEKLTEAWYHGEAWENNLNFIRDFHCRLAAPLFNAPGDACTRYFQPVMDQLILELQREPEGPFDQVYDRLVVYGELLSTALIRTYLEEEGVGCHYLDVRDLIVTDETWRDGNVDWVGTEARILQVPKDPRFHGDDNIAIAGVWLTQGFIGRSHNGHSVTLGREGSDYTAAIFGYCLDAEEVWIWKDVPGIMSADPAEFDQVVKLEEITYLEAIEMSFFGAKVLHPKTIKPLQNKKIPLIVKDFRHPQEAGTRIFDVEDLHDQAPAFIIKRNQVLITFQPRDFSFIVEAMISEIFSELHRYRVKVNLMQHAAISLTICVTHEPDKVNSLISGLLPRFRILYNTNLELLTIRRYTQNLIREMTGERRVLVQQLSRRTARFVLG